MGIIKNCGGGEIRRYCGGYFSVSPCSHGKVFRTSHTSKTVCSFFSAVFHCVSNCGGGEIRTHGALRHSCFQDKCDRPLCHASVLILNHFFIMTKFFFNPVSSSSRFKKKLLFSGISIIRKIFQVDCNPRSTIFC